jgi:mono/diheme cytochrome c family protein
MYKMIIQCRYRRNVFLTLLVSGALAACSDDSTNPKLDSGLDGAVIPDARIADGRVDTSVPDVKIADGAGVDGAADQAAIDSAIDKAAIDGVSADGGHNDGTTVDVSGIDAAGVDAPAGDDGGLSLTARGKYLVDNVIACSDCHTPKLLSGAPDRTRYLAGNPTFVQLPNGDVLPSRNLTPDPATGLGRYTADQIKRMFLDGVSPSGDGGVRALNSRMPYYVFHNMAPLDADAIVAYLQSIPAVNQAIANRSASFDVSEPSDYLDPAVIPTPAASYPQQASALRGRYLAAESGLCIECHTPHLATGSKTLDTSKLFWGGEDFSSLFASTLKIHPVSANLTSDPTTGLGTWTAEQIETALLQGKDDHGDGICPPMPAGTTGAYGGLTQQDATDIANYILSLPPAINDVPDTCTWPLVQPAVDGGSHDSGAVGSDVSSNLDTSAVDGT